MAGYTKTQPIEKSSYAELFLVTVCRPELLSFSSSCRDHLSSACGHSRALAIEWAELGINSINGGAGLDPLLLLLRDVREGNPLWGFHYSGLFLCE